MSNEPKGYVVAVFVQRFKSNTKKSQAYGPYTKAEADMVAKPLEQTLRESRKSEYDLINVSVVPMIQMSAKHFAAVGE